MEETQKINNIVESAQQKIQDEIGGLIGTSFLLADTRTEIVPKKDILQALSGKKVVTRIEISGDISGIGHILIDVKDAIRLGGTLIMLPPAELDEHVENESYDEETEDSYGEITNIITGIYTALFGQVYEMTCKFERVEQQLVDCSTAAEQVELLIEDTVLYTITSTITLSGDQLGTLTLLLPATSFSLVEANQFPEQLSQTENDDSNGVDKTVDDPLVPEDTSEPEDFSEEDEISSAGDDVKAPGSFDVHDRKKDIDSLMELCRTSLQQEVGEIVGVELTLSEMNNQVITKEYFFRNEAVDKQVAATLEVTGDVKDCSYLCLGLKDAIRIGSTLLMLPSSELESSVTEESFTTDVQDAYDEIVDAISSVYTEVLKDLDNTSLEFRKKGIDRVVPMKVEIASDSPIADQIYYLNRFKIGLDGKEAGFLRMLFPLEMLGLEALAPDETIESVTDQDGLGQPNTVPDASLTGDKIKDETGVGSNYEKETGQLLIISDADPEAKRIHDILATQGISTVQLNFRDNVSDYLPGTFKAVLLVMREVDEQTLGMAIKINTSCSLPLIATGTSWTRSKVFKAVKYGVNDILLAPATADEISAKISPYLTSLAA